MLDEIDSPAHFPGAGLLCMLYSWPDSSDSPWWY
jgi:hypothetical protein